MFKTVRKEIDWAGRKLVLETGKIARQADAAVMASYGETMVLCTVVGQKKPKAGVDFLPLTVHYQERAFAAGKIPGGFFKREGKASEKETLASRLIDRPIRPLFPHNFYNDIQVICTVLSHDLINDPEILALVGTSAALSLSGIPFQGPIAASRVAFINNEFVLNPTLDKASESQLDLVVAGTKDSVMMVESEASELTEEQMLEAVVVGHKGFQPVIEMINEMVAEGNPTFWEVPQTDYSDLSHRMRTMAEKELKAAYTQKEKQLRHEKIDHIKDTVILPLIEEGNDIIVVNSLFKNLEQEVVRRAILEEGKRIDGRDSKTIRPIVSEVGILPKVHGSALFTRGETQALVITTLGTSQDEQIIDGLEGDGRENFLLHYNFPPYSVGETTPLKPPGRREIGHGKLAWRALRALMPSKADFPYTIRIVSEITESNGSSSMATVCGSSLAMMDAGIPLKSPVAGIAMGLILEKDGYVVLSDIMGDEDHLGDMDFKVAGTEEGITALQMDIKVPGITQEIMKKALEQAREGRLHILQTMANAISQSREQVSANAPTITTISIPRDKIREVIGSGGKVIKEICEVSGAKIDISDDGTVMVAATNGKNSETALQMIRNIVAEPEMNHVYDGTVIKIVDFGAFVNFLGSRDGLVHISEIADRHIASVNDVLSEGQQVKVKVVGIDNRGKIRLTMKGINQETGEDLSGNVAPEAEGEGERPSQGKRPASAPKEKNYQDNSRSQKPKRKYFN